MSLDIDMCELLCSSLCDNLDGEVDDLPPENVTQPTVSGSTAPTEEAETSNGTWISSTPTTFTYQWLLDGVDIIGATSSTLLLLLGWVGKTIMCLVKCTNSFGFTVVVSTSIVVEL